MQKQLFEATASDLKKSGFAILDSLWWVHEASYNHLRNLHRWRERPIKICRREIDGFGLEDAIDLHKQLQPGHPKELYHVLVRLPQSDPYYVALWMENHAIAVALPAVTQEVRGAQLLSTHTKTQYCGMTDDPRYIIGFNDTYVLDRGEENAPSGSNLKQERKERPLPRNGRWRLRW